jgi:dienelactone hydrolase
MSMKKVFALALSMLLLISPALGEGEPSDRSSVAVDFIECLFDARIPDAQAQLTDEMVAALSPQGGLAGLAQQLSVYGKLVLRGDPSAEVVDEYYAVSIPLALEKSALIARVVLNAQDQVAGLQFLPGEDDAQVKLAKDVLTALFDARYAEVEALFTPDLASAVENAGGLQAVMEQILSAYGKPVSYGTASNTPAQGDSVVQIPIAFAEAQLTAIMSLSAEGKLSGLLFQSSVAVEDRPAPEGVKEQETTVDAGTGYPLGATIAAPDGADGPLPAVLLVTGSGQNARDTIVGANRVFAQLAHGLAQEGIISLRYDKRTFTYPELWMQPGFTVELEYTQDVLAAVEALKADPRVDADNVYILGLSEGAMIAPLFVDAGAEVKGLVLMAGSPRDLSEILYDQEMDVLTASESQLTEAQREEYAALYTQWKAEADALYAMDDQEALGHAPMYSGAFPAYYLYDLHRRDALALLKKHGLPVLILQGGNDHQISPTADYARYVEALEDQPYARFRLYEHLSHIFMPSVATNLSEAVAEYNVPSEIPDEVFSDIAAFVKG